MKDLPNVILWSIPAFVVLVVLEIVSYLKFGHDDELGYAPADTRTSLFMGAGSVVIDKLWAIPFLAMYDVLYTVTPMRGVFSDHLLYTLPAALFVWPRCSSRRTSSTTGHIGDTT